MDTAGFILGIFCGLLLYAVFAKGLLIAVGPYKGDRNFHIALAILVAITIVKLAMLHVLPGEPVDLSQFLRWGQALTRFGPTHIYETQFLCNYTPAYFYALWPGWALAPDNWDWQRMFVEGITVLGDFFLGLAAYGAVRRIADVRFAIPTILFLALNPAMFYTSTVWGQNDSAIAFPVLLSVRGGARIAVRARLGDRNCCRDDQSTGADTTTDSWVVDTNQQRLQRLVEVRGSRADNRDCSSLAVPAGASLALLDRCLFNLARSFPMAISQRL